MATSDSAADIGPFNDHRPVNIDDVEEVVQPVREVYMRHASGLIIYEDEVADLIASGQLVVFRVAGGSSSSSSSYSSVVGPVVNKFIYC